jgi:fructose-bisphosphate aldolase class II
VRYEAFGAAGKASKIRALALDTMVQRYERGELEPTVARSCVLPK